MKLYTKNLLKSFLFLFSLIGIIFLSSSFIRDILNNPNKYFTTSNLSTSEINFSVVFTALITIAVLLSFIFYLLFTYRRQLQGEIWNTIKSISLSKEQFQKLYDNAPMPYIMLGKNAEVHDPNKATLRFFGVLPEDIENKNIFSYIKDGYENQASIFFEYYKTGVSIDRKEVDFITKTGDVKSTLLSVFKMKDVAGPSNNAGLAMIFDVTEQKLLSKAKTEFVSLASHQLRTPLATIKWYTEMLISGDLGELLPKQKEYIEKLNSVNKDMIELVEVLLNVSRIEMGSLPISLKTINAAYITESILAELAPQIENKKIKINKQYNNSLENINSDPRLLRIVIHNIISNAVKYTLDGGTVSITFEESNQGNREKKIIIRDTGIGIPRAEQSRIFNKLFRADNARTLDSSHSTGLGLYLVKSMMESMGGRISFESEENKGSTFTLTF